MMAQGNQQQQQQSAVAVKDMPTFTFAARKGRVDWRRVATIDVDRVQREIDTDTLSDLLQNVAFCNLESEDVSDVDPNIVKLFRLSQLMLEYVLRTQDHLMARAGTAEKRAAAAEQELNTLRRQYETLRCDDKKRRKAVATYQQLLHSGDLQSYPCQYCEKVFVSPTYLLAHLERRHPQHAPFEVPDDTSRGARSEVARTMANMREEMTRLQDEVRLTRQQMTAEAHNAQVRAEMQNRAEAAERRTLEEQRTRQMEDSFRTELHQAQRQAAELAQAAEERHAMEIKALQERILQAERAAARDTEEAARAVARARQSNLGELQAESEAQANLATVLDTVQEQLQAQARHFEEQLRQQTQRTEEARAHEQQAQQALLDMSTRLQDLDERALAPAPPAATCSSSAATSIIPSLDGTITGGGGIDVKEAIVVALEAERRRIGTAGRPPPPPRDGEPPALYTTTTTNTNTTTTLPPPPSDLPASVGALTSSTSSSGKPPTRPAPPLVKPKNRGMPASEATEEEMGADTKAAAVAQSIEETVATKAQSDKPPRPDPPVVLTHTAEVIPAATKPPRPPLPSKAAAPYDSEEDYTGSEGESESESETESESESESESENEEEEGQQQQQQQQQQTDEPVSAAAQQAAAKAEAADGKRKRKWSISKALGRRSSTSSASKADKKKKDKAARKAEKKEEKAARKVEKKEKKAAQKAEKKEEKATRKGSKSKISSKSKPPRPAAPVSPPRAGTTLADAAATVSSFSPVKDKPFITTQVQHDEDAIDVARHEAEKALEVALNEAGITSATPGLSASELGVRRSDLDAAVQGRADRQVFYSESREAILEELNTIMAQEYKDPVPEGTDGSDAQAVTDSIVGVVTDAPRQSILVTYTILVTTGQPRGAGTDAKVSCVIYGEHGDSGTLLLDNGRGRKMFERKQTDEFSFELPALGALQRLDIWHDNGGLWASWHLAQVVVKTSAPHMASRAWTFICGQWFDKRSGDKKIFRELTPAAVRTVSTTSAAPAVTAKETETLTFEQQQMPASTAEGTIAGSAGTTKENATAVPSEAASNGIVDETAAAVAVANDSITSVAVSEPSEHSDSSNLSLSDDEVIFPPAPAAPTTAQAATVVDTHPFDSTSEEEEEMTVAAAVAAAAASSSVAPVPAPRPAGGRALFGGTNPLAGQDITTLRDSLRPTTSRGVPPVTTSSRSVAPDNSFDESDFSLELTGDQEAVNDGSEASVLFDEPPSAGDVTQNISAAVVKRGASLSTTAGASGSEHAPQDEIDALLAQIGAGKDSDSSLSADSF